MHTVLRTTEGVPHSIHFTSAATHDHVMLKKLNLSNGSFIAMDRAYIDLYQFCENPENAWLKIIAQRNLSPPEPTLFD